MSTPNRTSLQQARQLRRETISRMINTTASAISDWLRERHESALRKQPRPLRMRPVNAMPA